MHNTSQSIMLLLLLCIRIVHIMYDTSVYKQVLAILQLLQQQYDEAGWYFIGARLLNLTGFRVLLYILQQLVWWIAILSTTLVASIISTSSLFFIDLCTNECILLVRYLFDLVGSKVHHVYELVVGKAKPDRRKTDGRQNERSRCERRAHTHQTNASQLHVFLFSRAQSAH